MGYLKFFIYVYDKIQYRKKYATNLQKIFEIHITSGRFIQNL